MTSPHDLFGNLLTSKAVLYYLAFPNDWLYMKCLVYGIYTLEVVRSAIITEHGFRTYVTSLGDVQIINRVETGWLNPTLTAIGERSRTEYEWVSSNVPPRYILCPGILCTSDQSFGTVQESCGSNCRCKFSKEVYYI
jgi:hypothetical protein